MSNEELNKMCIDCKRPYPLFASINNGVFICDDCAILHKSMGSHISLVRHLKDRWDEYLLSYMNRGGNSRFTNIIEEYNIGLDVDPLYKYRTKAIENYRQIVKIFIIILVKI
jgi:ADP-ribosylation factor GTPase-activating protein 1